MLRRQGLAGLSRVTPLSQGIRSGYSSSLGGRIKRDPELAAPHHEAFGVWALFRKSATRGVMGQHTRARHYATSTAVTPTEKESILGLELRVMINVYLTSSFRPIGESSQTQRGRDKTTDR